MLKKKIDIKTKIGYVIIIVILVLLVVIISCLRTINYSIGEIHPVSNTKYTTTTEDINMMDAVKRSNDTKNLSDVLKVTDSDLYLNGDIIGIKAKVINNTKNLYTYVEVVYNLYDKNNNIIGVLSTYTSLKGGETTTINALNNETFEIDFNKIDHFKLASIKGIENK